MTTKNNKKLKSAFGPDWQAVKRSLKQTTDAIDALDFPDENRQQQILRERAASLAGRGTSAQPDRQAGPSVEVLKFRCAGEKYAFETDYIAQVYPICPITPVPGVPEFVVGVIPVQGEVLSVIDLRLLLNLPISRLEDPTSVIVMKNKTMEFGILAEEILGIKQYYLDSLERELPTLTDAATTYLTGVSAGRTAILNADQLLSDSRLVVEIS